MPITQRVFEVAEPVLRAATINGNINSLNRLICRRVNNQLEARRYICFLVPARLNFGVVATFLVCLLTGFMLDFELLVDTIIHPQN